MNWSFIIITSIPSIICTENFNTFERIGPYRKVDKETLNLKITDDSNQITVTLKSQEYIAIYGIWSTGMFEINSDEFSIDQSGASFWIDKNITDKHSLEEALNSLGDRIFEHETPRDAFYKKSDDLEFSFVIFKKDDFRNLAIEYLNFLNSSEPLSTFDRHEQIEKVFKSCRLYYGVKYNNKTNKIPEDLNDYELVIYKKSTLNDFTKPLGLLKKSAIDITVNMILTFTFFGVLLVAGRYSLSKYF